MKVARAEHVSFSIATRLLFGTCLLLVLSGCSSTRQWYQNGFKVGPEYHRPIAPVQQQWLDTDQSDVVSTAEQEAAWWSVFNDPALDRLVMTAHAQNLPLRVACLRIVEARAQRGIIAGNLFPQLQQAFANYTRQQRSLNSYPKFNAAMPRRWDNWATGFDVSWELDLWGRLRRSIDAADAELDATVENYNNVLVTLIGDVAATYIELRAFDERIELVQQNVAIQEGSLRIAQSRFRNGRATELDVAQAETNLENTKALVPLLKKGHRLTQNRLAVLLGMPPQNMAEWLEGTKTIPHVPTTVAVGIPADLLRRRPDVRLAERKLAAQSERIGIAKANFYPMLALRGSLSVSAENLDELFVQSSTAGFISPTFRWNILNYGRIKNNVRVHETRYQQLVFTYENTVLKASQEAENAITEFLQGKQRQKHLLASAEAATRAVKTVQVQYREGGADFGRVFVLEAALVTQQEKLVQSRADVALALIHVYKALGGGWQFCCEPSYLTNSTIVSEKTQPLPSTPPEPTHQLANKVKLLPSVHGDLLQPMSLVSQAE